MPRTWCAVPRVRDDNAYAESLFRTTKYRPEFPTMGFADLDHARIWAADFVHWYNFDHRHSGIRYVSPAQRHADDDHATCLVPPGAFVVREFGYVRQDILSPLRLS